MLKSLLQRAGFEGVAAIVLGAAAAIAVISGSYGLYAALRLSFGPAGSAGLTAAAAAILCALLVAFLLRPAKPRAKHGDPDTLRDAFATGAAMAAASRSGADDRQGRKSRRKP